MRSAIIIHGLDDARAAFGAAHALGAPVTIISGPGGGGYGGPAWFKAVVQEAQAEFPDVQVTAILDCGDAPGLVLGAFRAGLKTVRFTGQGETAAKLADIAKAHDAVLITEGVATIDLRTQRDAVAACKAWLFGHLHA
jgi:hypothetical protein